jgi:hypothetical protein
MASQDIRYSGWYVCESDLGHSSLTTRQRDGQSPSEMAVGSVEKMLGVRDTTPSWCVMRECGLEPLQFNWFRGNAAVHLFDQIQQQHDEKCLTCWHAAEYTVQWLLVGPYSLCHGWPDKKKKKKNKLRRQWKPLPTLINEKEPLWYRVPWSSSTAERKGNTNGTQSYIFRGGYLTPKMGVFSKCSQSVRAPIGYNYTWFQIAP